MSDFQVEQIDHVAIDVADLKRSREWYAEVLGLERRFAHAWGEVPTMMCVPADARPGAGETCVALFPGDAGATPGAGGIQHFAFRVDGENFRRAQDALRERKIEFRFADHGASHSVYIHDPDGHQIEITTYEL